jgi:hypothetical protein
MRLKQMYVVMLADTMLTDLRLLSVCVMCLPTERCDDAWSGHPSTRNRDAPPLSSIY